MEGECLPAVRRAGSVMDGRKRRQGAAEGIVTDETETLPSLDRSLQNVED